MQCSCCDVHVLGQPHRAVPHGHREPSSHALALGELLLSPPLQPPAIQRSSHQAQLGAEAQWVPKWDQGLLGGGVPSDSKMPGEE